ncbi:MAG: hypothetical protein ACREP0_12695 [Rhodanobacteraceae bacterium]
MQDRLDQYGMNEDASLGAALRALPAVAPAQDAWPALAARVRRRRTVRRTVWYSLPPAFGLGIALVFAWPHLHLRTAPPPAQLAQPSTRDVGAGARDVAALQAKSTQWQAWVRDLDHNGAPPDGRQLAQAVVLQDRIGLVDLQLSAARNPATVADLWQQRIALLQQLGLVYLQPYRVADQPHPGNAAAMPM